MKPTHEVAGVSIYCADALDLLRSLPDASVDLIATDPPYYGVKDEAWDNAWASERAFLLWIRDLCREWRRVLKPNGSLYVFASPDMAHGVERVVRRHFQVLNSIRWEKGAGWHKKASKETLRSFLSPWEAVIFAEQVGRDVTGLSAILNDQALFASVRDYFWSERQKVVHLSYNEINERMGMAANGGGMASNILNSRKLNWQFPRRETYELLASVTGVCQRPYRDLADEYASLLAHHEGERRAREDERRPFNVMPDAAWSDVWHYTTVPYYPGKHVCEKPLPMAQDIIRTSTRPGGVVLDTFCGSGVFGEAAANLGRLAILGDASPHCCRKSADRIGQDTLFSVVRDQAA